MQHGRVEDPDRLEDLRYDRIPQMSWWVYLVFEEIVHRRGQDEGVDVVIAQYFSGPPRVLPRGKGGVQFLLSRPCPGPATDLSITPGILSINPLSLSRQPQRDEFHR
jgi:hypothetical protein